MNDKRSFEIFIIKKVPFLTKFLFFVLCISAVLIFFTLAPFMPSKNATSETHTMYFMTILPSRIQNVWFSILFYSTTVFIVIFIMYHALRRRLKGVFVFSEDCIDIISKRKTENISIKLIEEINIYDPQDPAGFAREKLTIYLTLKNKATKRIRLIDYSGADLFMNRLFKYNSIKFVFINNNSFEPVLSNEE